MSHNPNHEPNSDYDNVQNSFVDSIQELSSPLLEPLEDEQEPKKKVKRGLFEKEHPMNVFLSVTGSLILTNIFFILCSIPVITMGASLTAMNKVCFTIREEGDVRVTKLFFKTFVANLLDGILTWIVNLGILSACGFGLYMLMTQETGTTGRAFLAGLCGLGAILVLIELCFCYALMFRYENHALAHLKNAFLIGLSHLGWVLVILVMWGGVIAIYALVPGALLYAGWAMLLIGFSLLAFITSKIYGRIFRKLEKGKKEAATDIKEAEADAKAAEADTKAAEADAKN